MMLFLMLLFKSVSPLTCTFTLTGIKTVGISTGTFDVEFTTTQSAAYATLSYTTNWSIDTSTSIASSTFKCFVSSNQCTTQTLGQQCGNVNSIGYYKISCTGMNTPTFSGVSQGQFSVKTYNSGNSVLESCVNQEISGFVAGSLSLNGFTLSSLADGGTPSLNTDSSLGIIIGTGTALASGDLIKFSFSGYTFNYDAFQSIPSTTYKSSTSLSFLSATTSTIIKGKQITFEFNTLKISPCVKDNTISAITYRTTENQIIDQLATNIFTPAYGILSISDISLISQVVGIQSTYTITVSLYNALTITGWMKLKIPNTLTYTDLTCSAIVNLIEKTGSCGINSNYVQIKDAFGLAPTNNVILKLQFKNVATSSETAIFTELISYYDSNTCVVDQLSTSFTVSGYIQPTTLGTITITLDTYKVGQQTNIQFSFTTVNKILANSYILFDISSDIAFIASNQCLLQNIAVSCVFTLNGLQAKLASIFTTDIQSSVVVTIKILNAFRNPYTFQPINNGFSLKIFDQNDIAFDSKLYFGSITMTQQSDITASLDRTNKQNGNLAIYTFTLTFQTEQPALSQLNIQLSGFKFASISVTLDSTTIPNSVTGDKITIAIPTTITKGLTKSIIINNIYNPDSYQPTSAISIWTKTSDAIYSISQSTSTITVINDQVNLITVNSMVSENGILNQQDNYQFSFTTTNQLTTGSLIKLIVPNQITMPAITDCNSYLSNVAGFTPQSCTLASNVITITPSNFGSTANYQFTFLNLFTNPSVQQILPIYFTIETYRSTYPMDITPINEPKLQFQTKCTFPCKTCSSPTTQCLSCYAQPISTKNMLYNNQCQSTCPSNNQVCTACFSQCLECNSSGCSKCSDKYQVKSGLCALICLENQYDLNNSCSNCDSNCKTCQTTSTHCLSCSSGQFLYANTCVSECPSTLFQVGLTCVGCQSPCKECLTSPTSCKICISNYSLKGTDCLSKCGDNYFSLSETCKQCVYPCYNCQDENICLDCSQAQGNRYLHNGNCLSSCPDRYYLSGNSCIQCEQICGNCSSKTICTSCPLNKYLMGSNCVDSCPSKYFSLNFVCQSCDESCPNCSSITNCTGCPENTFHLSGKCLVNCPTKYFNNSNDNQCINCQTSCKTCINGTECTECPEKTYFLNLLCVSQCPDLYYLQDSKTCIACKIGCATCDVNGCLSCSANYKKQNFECLTACPSGYQENNGICEFVTPNEQKVIENLQENKYIPVPFTIISLVLFLSIVVAKIQRPETFVPGSAIGLGGLLVLGSWITIVLILQDYLKIELLILEAAIVSHILLNFLNLALLKCATHRDLQFDLWYNANRLNACSHITLNILSLLSFSLTRLQFSRYFGFRFLKCKVSTIEQLLPLHIVNGLIILFGCIPACVATVMIAYQDTKREQLFISAIDSFIVTIIMVLFLVWETQKDDNFFEDSNYHSTHLSNRILPEFFQSQIRQRFSFEEVSMSQKNFDDVEHLQDQEPSIPKIPEEDNNSSLDDLSDIIKKQKNTTHHHFDESVNQSILMDSAQPIIKKNDSIYSLSSLHSNKLVPQNSQFTFNKNPSEQSNSNISILPYQSGLLKESFKQSFLPQTLDAKPNLQQTVYDSNNFDNEQSDQQQIQSSNFRVEEQENEQSDDQLQQSQIHSQTNQNQIDDSKPPQSEIQASLQQSSVDNQLQQQNQQQSLVQEQDKLQLDKQQQEQQEQEKQQQYELQQKQEQEKILQEQKLIQNKQEDELLEQQRQEQQLQETKQKEQLLLEQQKQNQILLEQQNQENQRQQQLKQEEEQKKKQIKQDELQSLLDEERMKAEQIDQQQKQQQQLNDQQQEKEKEQEQQQSLNQSQNQSQNQEESESKEKNQQQQQLQLLVSDQDADDQEWGDDILAFQEQSENISEAPQVVIGQRKQKVIVSEYNDNDEDWDVPSSGFMSQQKSCLKQEQPVEEPKNPFHQKKQQMQSQKQQEQVSEDQESEWNAPPRAFMKYSDIFKASNESEDDWSANQISPSDFNAMNQRFENERQLEAQSKKRQFFRTGENFQRIQRTDFQSGAEDGQFKKKHSADNQQPEVSRDSKKKDKQKPPKPNKKLDKIYLQRLQTVKGNMADLQKLDF